ncbi:MAG: hypothetical protein AAF384_06260 [Pseudomonadota bacterium]
MRRVLLGSGVVALVGVLAAFVFYLLKSGAPLKDETQAASRTDSCTLSGLSRDMLKLANDATLHGSRSFAFDIAITLIIETPQARLAFNSTGEGRFVKEPAMRVFVDLKNDTQAEGLQTLPQGERPNLKIWFVDGVFYSLTEGVGIESRKRCDVVETLNAMVVPGRVLAIPGAKAFLPNLADAFGNTAAIEKFIDQFDGFAMQPYLCSYRGETILRDGRSVAQFSTEFDLDEFVASGGLSSLIGSLDPTGVVTFLSKGALQNFQSAIERSEVTIRKTVPIKGDPLLKELVMDALLVLAEHPSQPAMSQAQVNILTTLRFHGYDADYTIATPSGFDGVACQ